MIRAALCAVLVLAAGCGEGGARPVTRRAEIRAFRFVPDTVRAAPGDTVVWTNHDVVPHTATAADGWNTGQIGARGSGRIVAGAPGTYAYVCAYHPSMRGTLVVH